MVIFFFKNVGNIEAGISYFTLLFSNSQVKPRNVPVSKKAYSPEFYSES